MEDIVIAGYGFPRKRIAIFTTALALWLLGLMLLHFGFQSGSAPTALLRFLPLAPFLASWLLAGFPVLKTVIENILPDNAPAAPSACCSACRELHDHDARRHGVGKAIGRVFRNLLDENFLMFIATVGAFAVGEWEEAAGVMIFFMIGEIIQEAAVDRSRSSIDALLALKPDKARVQDGGEWKEVPAGEVNPGTVVLVRPGERIPLDGIIVEGESSIDASMLTGESRPLPCASGDEVKSGTVTLNGVLRIKTTRRAGDSSAARIVRLVQSAQETKAKPERFITAFARRYTPVVVGAAFLLAVLPPLFIPGARFADWFYRALILLVISCPCALVVSVPLGYFAGIGGMSRRGIMVKGATHLDHLYGAKNVAFDKTGTLTKGKFSVAAIEIAPDISGELFLETAALAERESNHPIAKAIMEYSGEPCGAARAENESRAAEGGLIERGYTTREESVKIERFEIPGQGVEVISGGVKILAGNRRLLESGNIEMTGAALHDRADAQYRAGDGGMKKDAAGADPDADGEPGESSGAYTPVYIARDGKYLGRFLIGDTLKEGALEAVKKLREMGIQTTMLTGDTRSTAGEAASRLGISSVRAELLPEDKLAEVKKLARSGVTVFIGDGINDAPVLAGAHVGIAMGSGADVAVEAADVIVMTDDPRRVPEAIERARKTRRIVMGNVVFALGAKGIFIILAALGLANMWIALIADVGVALVAILNSTRALGNKL